MNAHAPGPWTSRLPVECDNPAIMAWIDDAAGIPVADVKRSGHTEANASLIASAPDLLAERDRLRRVNAQLLTALKGLLPYAQMVIHSTDDAHDRDQLTAARAAIAAAETAE